MKKIDEKEVLKKYSKIIDALIPYEHQGKSLEGLNKFSAVLPTNVRNAIKEEVKRLTSLTDASADNSLFASYPVQRFKHFGIDMKLDKVGQKILLQESAKYLDRYTVGVFESVMNSDHYQSHIKQAQQQKIAQAFSVQAQSFADIDFGHDLAVRPRISVTCSHFDKGKSCAVASLSNKVFKIETNRIPEDTNEEDLYVFVFPEIHGLCAKGTKIHCLKSSGGFNKTTHKFETEFTFVPPTPRQLIEAISHYISQMVHMLPLERDLELERVIQNLDRDHILANSPWIPLFLSSKGSQVSIDLVLMSQVNFEFNGGFNTIDKLPGKKRLNTLMPELKKFSEIFLLRGVFNTKNGPITVSASIRELQASKILAPFIKMINQTQALSVLQLRLVPITDAPKDLAYEIHDMSKRDYPEIDDITYVLFCKDVSEQIGTLTVPEDTPNAKFPSVIIDKEESKSPQVLLESTLERRTQARYKIDKPAVIRTGLLSKVDAVVEDMSEGGMKLSVNEPAQFESGQSIKVSSTELKIKNEKYNVVAYDEVTGSLRLIISDESTELKQHLANLIESNASYFKARNLELKQHNIYRHLWELSIRHIPCVAILVTHNRHIISRLSTVYCSPSSKDLYPFKPGNNKIPMHGFFADKDAEKPASTLLQNMLSHAQPNAHVVHALRPKDKRIIFVEESAFLYGKVRDQIITHVGKGEIEACVTQINAIKCKSHHTPLTKKRLAFISTIDLELYEKMKDLQKVYTHVIYMTNMSSLHNAFLASAIKPVKK